MRSFISSFKAIILAAVAILLIEAVIYAAVRPTFIERSNYLAWQYNGSEPFRKLLVFQKMIELDRSSPDIIQVGDSSGFHGVNPKIVEQYLGGLKYYDLSCCANTGFQGYYDLAEYALARDKNVKAVVLYIAPGGLPRTDDFRDNTGTPDEIHDAVSTLWAKFSPPSQALRPAITDAVYSLEGSVLPRNGGISTNGTIREMLNSVRRDSGWLHEIDPRTTGKTRSSFWQGVCRGKDASDVSAAANHHYYYRRSFWGPDVFEPYRVFERFAKLAESHGARLVIFLHPYPCETLPGNTLSLLRDSLDELRAKHSNVTVLPPHLFEHWPSIGFVSREHLRIGLDVINSHRVGRLLSESLGIQPQPTKVAALDIPGPNVAMADILSPSAALADMKLGPNILMPAQVTERWLKAGIDLVPAADGAQMLREAAGVMHHTETLIPNVEAGKPYILSVEIKPVGARMIRFALRDSTQPGSYGSMDCNPSREAASRIGGTYDAGIDALPDGWYRCWASLVYKDTQAAVGIDILGTQSASLPGDGKSGILMRNVQFRQGWRLPLTPIAAN